MISTIISIRSKQNSNYKQTNDINCIVILIISHFLLSRTFLKSFTHKYSISTWMQAFLWEIKTWRKVNKFENRFALWTFDLIINLWSETTMKLVTIDLSLPQTTPLRVHIHSNRWSNVICLTNYNWYFTVYVRRMYVHPITFHLFPQWLINGQ